MLTLISCAKTMTERPVKTVLPSMSSPRYQNEATQIAWAMTHYNPAQLQNMLRINGKLALANYHRYQEFHATGLPALPAIMGYTGMVFKQIRPSSLTKDDFLYAQEHLRITSFCYGLLRPLDIIRPYRLEGNVRLPELDEQTLFHYWRPLLTDWFIHEIKLSGGILLNAASAEMKGLFEWSRIEQEAKVITPEFRVEKGDRLTTIVIYTKMLRGLLTRHVIQERIKDPQLLKSFTAEGFEYDESLSDESHPFFVLR